MVQLRKQATSKSPVSSLSDPPKNKNGPTVTWAELPEWMQDNKFITSGYRRELRSWRSCARSIYAYLHNETVNIHSHLIGAVIFASLALITYPTILSVHPSTTWHDVAGFYIFICAAVFCLSSSATYHAASCHSAQVSKSCNALDYTGIVTLIVGSFVPSLYYGFFCDTTLQVIYLSAIIIAGAFAAYIVLEPSYGTPAYRWARTSVFLGLGLGGIVPTLHAFYVYGFHRMRHEMGIVWLLASGAFYASGAIIYASRVPERWAPGRFDYFFASHQIFHTHVVLAALCHYASIATAFQHHHGIQGGLCHAAANGTLGTY